MPKYFYFVLGWLFFAIGIIGAFVPILPTTPFMLLAAYFFSKSSEKTYQWLIGLPKIGASIQDWNEHGVIKKSAKITCLATLAVTIICLFLFSKIAIEIKITNLIIFIAIGFFVATRPSKNPFN